MKRNQDLKKIVPFGHFENNAPYGKNKDNEARKGSALETLFSDYKTFLREAGVLAFIIIRFSSRHRGGEF